MDNNQDKTDKLKQLTALIGGFLSAVMLFLGTVGVAFDWLTAESIDAAVAVIGAGGLLLLNLYGVYKNSYVLTEKAKQQEEALKEQGLK